MVRAKDGDTLLHLALRVNGATDAEKTELVTELLGRGCSFEVPKEPNAPWKFSVKSSDLRAHKRARL